MNCSLLNAQREEECQKEVNFGNAYFSDTEVIQRLQDCKTYFKQIKTVAFEPVSYVFEFLSLKFR